MYTASIHSDSSHSPTVPTRSPPDGPKATRLLISGVRASSSISHRGAEAQFEHVRGGAENRSHHQCRDRTQSRATAHGHDRRDGSENDARRHQGERGRAGDHHRLQDEAELCDAEVEFDLEDRQADQQATERAGPQEPDSRAVLRRVTGGGHPALVVQEQDADSDSPAPPISIRCVGPHSVTSCPKIRCQTSSSGNPMRAYSPPPATRTPPTGTYQVR